jgi:hypothetical protein
MLLVVQHINTLKALKLENNLITQSLLRIINLRPIACAATYETAVLMAR